MTTRLVRAALLVVLGALTSVVGCTVEDRTDAGDELDGGSLRGFGEGCTRTEDCASGLCLLVGPRSICTDLCTDDADCPTAPNWGCVEPEALGARVCGCNGSSDTEVCGNGRDDDCNGEVDECRICDGVPVAEDDPAHCGACDNACRFDQECSSGACRCPAGLTDCGGVCVDTETSTAHCGACDDACEPGAACVGGACACGSPELSLCAGVGCVDLSSSIVHCGVCGNRCASGGVCRDGSCECTSTTATDCDGVCVETGSDVDHCGGCGVACLPGEVCSRGTCSCDPSTPDRCSTACVDLRYDPANCGSCGFSCATGAVCVAGACRCPRGGRECDGVCYAPGDEGNCGGCGLTCPAGQYCEDSTDACACAVFGGAPCPDGSCHDWLNDPLNCGGCGVACRPTEVCASGSCVCPSGTYCPGDGCVSLDRDPANCGGCGVACDPTQTCSFGTCRCPTGTTLCPGFGCVSTASDLMNCGGCGNACPSGTACTTGTCGCPGAATGEVYCASATACVNTRTAHDHCGACDHVCPADAECMSGTCFCTDAGLTACGATCIDPQTDEANCGTCGNTCSSSMTCLYGRCTCVPPTLGSEVRVTDTADTSEGVRIAWNGSEGMVAWIERSLGVRQAFVQRVSADGALMGAALQVSAGYRTTFISWEVSDLDIVWTGAEWAVAWIQGRVSTPLDLHVARIARDGTLVATSMVETGLSGLEQVRVVFTSTFGYVLIWRGASEIMLRPHGPTATTPGTLRTVFTPPSWRQIDDMAVLTNPADQIGVLFTGVVRVAGIAPLGAHFQVVNSDGSLTAPRVSLATTDASSPALAYESAVGWVGAWRTAAGLMLGRGSSLGSRTTVYAATARARSAALTVLDSVATVTWQETTDTTAWIAGRRYFIPASGAATPLDLVSSTYMATTSVYDQPHGMVAVPGGVILAWADSRWGATEVYEQLVSMTPCAP